MRFAIGVGFLATINCWAALAAPEECRLIKTEAVRQACYHRQPNPVEAKRALSLSDNSRVLDPVEALKLEDDRLAKRLQGICRGC